MVFNQTEVILLRPFLITQDMRFPHRIFGDLHMARSPKKTPISGLILTGHPA